MLAQATCLLDLILKGMSGMSSIDVMQSNQNNLIPYEILTTSVKSQRKKAKSEFPRLQTPAEQTLYGEETQGFKSAAA